jgi:hypothetical protein
MFSNIVSFIKLLEVFLLINIKVNNYKKILLEVKLLTEGKEASLQGFLCFSKVKIKNY